MEELNLIIQDFEETCSTLAITHDRPCEESIKEKFEEYHQAKLKLLGIANVVGSALVEIENPYIEDAENVLRGDIYTVDGRVSKCWILESDFDDIKCTHN